MCKTSNDRDVLNVLLEIISSNCISVTIICIKASVDIQKLKAVNIVYDGC